MYTKDEIVQRISDLILNDMPTTVFVAQRIERTLPGLEKEASDENTIEYEMYNTAKTLVYQSILGAVIDKMTTIHNTKE